MKNYQYIILLLAVTSFLAFFGLGDMALTDPDETFYAETAKEMASAGEWITPTIFGNSQFEKPILYYWLILGSYSMFGINEFAARFPSALFGMIGVIGVFFLGRLLFSSLCGFLSGLVLATCVQYVILSRACVTDMVLLVFILYTFFFFISGWISRRKWPYIASSFLAALAVLTKGPIGLFIPGAIILLYILITRQWRRIREIPIVWCALIFFAVSLPWYIVSAKLHGASFIDEFFGFHNIVRFLEPEHRIGSSVWFYVPVILGGFFPWSAFLPWSAWDMYKKRKNDAGRYGLLLAIWVFVVFMFFTASRTKLVTYIFPLFPPMALIVGRLWERFIRTGEDADGLKGRIGASYALLLSVSFLAFGIMCFFISGKYTQTLHGTIFSGVVFVSFLSMAAVFYLRNKRALSFASVILATMAIVVSAVIFMLPVIEEFESSKAISCFVKDLAGPKEAIAGESDTRRGIAFYTDRINIEDVHSYDDLKSFFSRSGRVWCIMKRKHYDQFKEQDPELVSEILMQTGKKVVVTNQAAAAPAK